MPAPTRALQDYLLWLSALSLSVFDWVLWCGVTSWVQRQFLQHSLPPRRPCILVTTTWWNSSDRTKSTRCHICQHHELVRLSRSATFYRLLYSTIHVVWCKCYEHQSCFRGLIVCVDICSSLGCALRRHSFDMKIFDRMFSWETVRDQPSLRLLMYCLDFGIHCHKHVLCTHMYDNALLASNW